MDFETVALSTVIGFLAGAAAAYSQNWIPGFIVLALGSVVLFGLAGSGLGGTVDNFVQAVGPMGVFGAVAGGLAGVFVGDHIRKGQQPNS